MTRQNRSYKTLIYVFCEGESEQAYTDFIIKGIGCTDANLVCASNICEI